MNFDDVRVDGPATAEDVAAILAALRLRQRPTDAASRFEQWRRERIRALRDNSRDGRRPR